MLLSPLLPVWGALSALATDPETQVVYHIFDFLHLLGGKTERQRASSSSTKVAKLWFVWRFGESFAKDVKRTLETYRVFDAIAPPTESVVLEVEELKSRMDVFDEFADL